MDKAGSFLFKKRLVYQLKDRYPLGPELELIYATVAFLGNFLIYRRCPMCKVQNSFSLKRLSLTLQQFSYKQVDILEILMNLLAHGDIDPYKDTLNEYFHEKELLTL
jgi:hypothetical protein